jgi:hypothetical protein
MCHFRNLDCSLKDVQLLLSLGDWRPLLGHVYIIIDRGKPLSDIEFCSMWCTETYVDDLPGNWEIISESFPFDADRKNAVVHAVEIRKRQDGLMMPREVRESGVH